MYACIFSPGGESKAAVRLDGAGDVRALASMFAPFIEDTAPGMVTFAIGGLHRMLGTTHQIASEICREGARLGIAGSLAISKDPDTAAIIARYKRGVTIVGEGEEAAALAELPLECLIDTHGREDREAAAFAARVAEMIDTFSQWGVRTLGQLAALPETELAARFGPEGARLHRLACGRTNRTLNLPKDEPTFARYLELDDSIELLEPLQFVLSPMLGELTNEMRQRALAAARVDLTLELEDRTTHHRFLELALPCRDASTLLKLLHLDLSTNPPAAPIVGVRVVLKSAPPQVLQHGLFLPASPEPQKMQIVLARLKGLVGEGNVGSPALLDTHRPNAFELRQFSPPPPTSGESRAAVRLDGAGALREDDRIKLAFRCFRPPLQATVRLHREKPAEVRTRRFHAPVRVASGPWRTNGEWWADTRWNRDEWDVELDGMGVYRIFKQVERKQVERTAASWFVEGVYD